MKLSSKTQALQDLIAPAVAACGVDLWGIEFLPQGKRSLLRIYIDTAPEQPIEQDSNDKTASIEVGRGVSVEDCVHVTHQVGALLDVHDPIAGEYALEVSSPGWDRPFFNLLQLQAYLGQQLSLRLIHAIENQRKFKAKLLYVDTDRHIIQVEVEQQKVLEIESDNLDKVHLIYQDQSH